MRNWFYLLVIVTSTVFSCNTNSKPKKKLPILGPRRVENIEINGGIKADTVYHTVPEFAFYDQDSVLITNKTFDGKVYVADFFFTSCPTICPIMKAQMLRVYDKFKDNPNVFLLSHTIDPATGRPINHDLASVTVIADNTTLADAWATAFDVLGREKSKQLAQQENLAVFFIYRSGDGFKTEYTQSMQTYLVK